MEEEDNRSSGAVQEMETENSRLPNEGQEENHGEKMEKIEGRRRVCSGSGSSSDCAGNSSRGESKGSDSKTLASARVSEGVCQADFDESSHVLSEVPVEFSLTPLLSAEESKGRVRTVHEESSKGITGQSARVQIQDHTQLPDGPSKLELSPTSVTQSNSSVPSRLLPKRKLQPVKNGNSCLTEEDKQNSPNTEPLSGAPMLKASDGYKYNWRKYGQKQVKSPEGSRSYYRCTFSDCYAKKIECCDRSNHLLEIVYRSHHNHDPPHKINCTRENRPSLPIVPVSGSTDTSPPDTGFSNPMPSAPSTQPLVGIDEMPETKQQESSGSDDTIEINMKEESADGPECKKRQKRNSDGELESVSKPGKKPKYVVHAAGDVGISGDGYRWRKYGQKMVKGNSHPRNYYRCTSAGCPARKHIEKAVDSTSEIVITYKGIHDHDTPVPRKRHSPKSAVGVAPSPLSSDKSQNKTKSHKSQTEWSVDKEGELMGEALNVGGEKASDSARMLLSVGFEIKPC